MPVSKKSLVLFFLFFTFSCVELVEVTQEKKYDGPVNSCNNNDDCPGGTFCHDMLSICHNIEPLTYSLKARIIFRNNEMPYQDVQVFIGDDFKAVSPISIKRKISPDKNIVCKKGVLTDPEKSAGAINAQVEFISAGTVIAGYAPFSAKHAIMEANTGFSFDLIPGKYNLRVEVTDNNKNSHPGVYLDGVQVMDDGRLISEDGESLSEIIVPPSTCQVKGIIKRGKNPVPYLMVEAVEKDSNRVISTSDITGSGESNDDKGAFTINLYNGVQEFSLRVTRLLEPQYPVTKIYGFIVDAGDSLLDLTGDTRLILASLDAPCHVHGRVVGEFQFEPNPIPDCQVIFESIDLEPELSATSHVVRKVHTDWAGYLRASEDVRGVELYPGTYRVTLIPEPAASGMSLDYSVSLMDESYIVPPSANCLSLKELVNATQFSLSAGNFITGTVIKEDRGIASTVIIAEPLGNYPRYMRSKKTTTDSSGNFELWIDNGDYRITARVPVESHYAWGKREITTAGVIALQFRMPFVLDIRIIAEEINLPDFSNLEIEWYEEIDGKGFMVARSTVDNDGNTTVFLPPADE